MQRNLKHIKEMKNKYKFQLKAEQVFKIAQYFKKNCNFLVFGLGNDSTMWQKLNKAGRTYFIEDNKEWFDRINKKNKKLNTFLVNYGTKITEWKKLLSNSKQLEMKLPQDIENIRWNVILVDAPCGALEYHVKEYGCEPPGRMKSIYMASKLIKSGGHVFVHDCHRQVEDLYCNKFLGKENLIEEIDTFRHYMVK